MRDDNQRLAFDLHAWIVATAPASPGASKIASWDLAVERNFDDSENHETADKVKVSFFSIFFRECSVTECSFFGFELDSLQIEVVYRLNEVDVSSLNNQYES